jgi:hypothetical protein
LVGAAALVGGIVAAPALWNATLGCPGQAKKDFGHIRAEVLTRVPPDLRSKAYASSGCDSFDRLTVSWTPKGDPQRSLELFAHAGWKKISASDFSNFDTGAAGYLMTYPFGTIEVVHFPVEGQIQADVR